MTLIVSLLLVALGTRLCEGSFSLLSEPREACAGYAGIADAIAALTKTISNQTTAGDPLLGVKGSLQELLQLATIYQSCDDVTGPSGLYRVRDGNDVPTQYFCQTEVLGGGWTVIQRRTNGRTNFTRSFNEYQNGFGHPEQEFWIGLTRLNRITSLAQYELLILMDAFDGTTASVRYTSFKVGPASDGFRLTTLSGYNSIVGDSMNTSISQTFSTFDRDTDSSLINCADVWRGGWWFNGCGNSNLNGFYNGPTPTTISKTSMVWAAFKGNFQSLKSSIMLIRKKRA
uniref:Fibrinogen C-terminal domain-containing protein n=1 Tax=Anopheles christyi TaxID=43041 RepID=A0A182JT07_9DIPT